MSNGVSGIWVRFSGFYSVIERSRNGHRSLLKSNAFRYFGGRMEKLQSMSVILYLTYRHSEPLAKHVMVRNLCSEMLKRVQHDGIIFTKKIPDEDFFYNSVRDKNFMTRVNYFVAGRTTRKPR